MEFSGKRLGQQPLRTLLSAFSIEQKTGIKHFMISVVCTFPQMSKMFAKWLPFFLRKHQKQSAHLVISFSSSVNEK